MEGEQRLVILGWLAAARRVWSGSSAMRRSYSSIEITTTTGLPCLATMTGGARARSISLPNSYLASFAESVRIMTHFLSPIMADLANLTMRHGVGALDSVVHGSGGGAEGPGDVGDHPPELRMPSIRPAGTAWHF